MLADIPARYMPSPHTKLAHRSTRRREHLHTRLRADVDGAREKRKEINGCGETKTKQDTRERCSEGERDAGDDAT